MAISSRLQIGDQFDHFQIRNNIAKGGMSDIYCAYDLLSGKDVVLKIPDNTYYCHLKNTFNTA